jgi:hypothetical protein
MKTMRVLSVILLIAALGFSSCGKKASTPGDVVKSMVEKMEAGDMGVKNLMASELAAMLGDEKLEAALQEESADIKEKGGVASITIVEEKIDGEKASVDYTIEYGNGEIDEESADLIMEDGKWKITASK